MSSHELLKILFCKIIGCVAFSRFIILLFLLAMCKLPVTAQLDIPESFSVRHDLKILKYG
jgi:hypothetical protein